MIQFFLLELKKNLSSFFFHFSHPQFKLCEFKKNDNKEIDRCFTQQNVRFCSESYPML